MAEPLRAWGFLRTLHPFLLLDGSVPGTASPIRCYSCWFCEQCDWFPASDWDLVNDAAEALRSAAPRGSP